MHHTIELQGQTHLYFHTTLGPEKSNILHKKIKSYLLYPKSICLMLSLTFFTEVELFNNFLLRIKGQGL
jgi:hypothetical protein